LEHNPEEEAQVVGITEEEAQVVGITEEEAQVVGITEEEAIEDQLIQVFQYQPLQANRKPVIPLAYLLQKVTPAMVRSITTLLIQGDYLTGVELETPHAVQ
jgi:predicted ThiF/HesA family dinucleotide-utilizing enzyme